MQLSRFDAQGLTQGLQSDSGVPGQPAEGLAEPIRQQRSQGDQGPKPARSQTGRENLLQPAKTLAKRDWPIPAENQIPPQRPKEETETTTADNAMVPGGTWIRNRHVIPLRRPQPKL